MYYPRTQHISQSFLEGIISIFKHLRVLDIGTGWFDELPRSIGELMHLRYLDISENPLIRSLPDTICRLLNLETFYIDGCEQLEELPTDVYQLQGLKNFRVTTYQISFIGTKFIELSCLQSLRLNSCKRMISLWDNANVGHLTSLHRLSITDCPKLSNLPNSMKFLVGLESLELVDCEELDLEKGESLDGLESLRVLIIKNLKLVSLPIGIQSAAASLQHLQIENCQCLVEIPDWMHLFTSLRTIVIEYCPNLLNLPKTFCHLNSLQELNIKGCPHLSKRCAAPAGEDFSLIRHVRHICLDNYASPYQSPLSKRVTGNSSNDYIPTSDKENDDGGEIEVVQPGGNSSHNYIPTFDKEHDDGEEIEVVQPRGNSSNSYIPTFDKEHDDGEEIEVVQPKGVSSEEGRSCMQKSELQNSCMLYCNLFGDSYEFEKEKLIQLWMAAGFLVKEPFEDNGDDIFDSLRDKEYILPSRIDISRQMTLYKVNHNLEVNVSNRGEEFKKFEMRIEDANAMAKKFGDSWHISVQSSNINRAFESLKKFGMLRTLLFLNGSLITQVPSDFFSTFKMLTALDLSGTRITELPSSIQDANELHYVDLSWTRINRLPQSIVHLQKLQTLRLKGCMDLFELPERMKELTSLRHLDFDVLGQLILMPIGIGNLTNLRTLPAFIVNGEKNCNINELKHMNNLSGKFCISGLEHVSCYDAGEAALIKNNHLKHLELRWSGIIEYLHKEELLKVLELLQPTSHLQELKIICYPGKCLPNWIGDPRYENLVSITLFRCEDCSEFPCLGRLPALKNLKIVEMNDVKKINHELCGDDKDRGTFPVLEKLSIDGMYKVEEWKGITNEDFPCLVKLSMNRCPNLTLLSSFPKCQSLNHLEITDCPQLKYLPEEMLSSPLKSLVICGCPFLIKSYSRGGEDSSKIEHVISVWIESEESESGNEYSTDDDTMIEHSTEHTHSDNKLDGND